MDRVKSLSNSIRSNSQRQILADEPSTIQRLLIFHPTLAELCEGRIDETSSLEELAESILYFHESSSPYYPDYANESAVQFLNLATALYTFPTSLSSDNESDRSQIIHFDKSILVFTVIEHDNDEEIVAVAQMSRTGSPVAISAALERCHGLFQLLHGGGILSRLKSNDHLSLQKRTSLLGASLGLLGASTNISMNSFNLDESEEPPPDMSQDCEIDVAIPNQSSSLPSQTSLPGVQQQQPAVLGNVQDDGCIYPGMKILCELRRTVRKQEQTMSKIKELLTVKRKLIMTKLNDATVQLGMLSQVLPIGQVRADLKVHFDEYLLEDSLSNQCLMELVPRPLSTPNFVEHDDSGAVDLSGDIESLLQQCSSAHRMDDPLLIAVSYFHQGNLTDTFRAEGSSIDVSRSTACMILGYMSSFAGLSQHERRDSTRGLHHHIQHLADDLKKKLDNNGTDKTPPQVDKRKEQTPSNDKNGVFLSSPPLVMLNIDDQLCQVTDDALGNVWTPVFYVRQVQVNVALFSQGNYSFLIYFDAGELDTMPPDTLQTSKTSFYDNYFTSDASSSAALDNSSSTNSGRVFLQRNGNQNQSPIARLLGFVSSRLSKLTPTMYDEGLSEESFVQVEKDDGAEDDDMHIIYINHDTHRVIIKLTTFVKRLEKRNSLLAGPAAVLGSFGRKQDNDAVSSSTDARQQLLHGLPLSLAVGLEDVLDNFHEKKSGLQEQCHYHKDGWVWAKRFAKDGQLCLVFENNGEDTLTVVQIKRRAERMAERIVNSREK